MAVNLDVLLQGPIFDFWAVPVTFRPFASLPGQPDYQGRGILNTYSIDIAAIDGSDPRPTEAHDPRHPAGERVPEALARSSE